MTPETKTTLLTTLSRILFPSKEQKDLQSRVIQSLIADLTPAELLPLDVWEVYRDSAHVVTNHANWTDAMIRVDAVRGKDNLHAIHIKQGDEVKYSWENSSL